MIEVSVKAAGSRRKPLDDFSVPIPPNLTENGPVTLKDLITTVVRHEISAYQDRQQKRRLVHVLTRREITQGRRTGKIESGGSEIDPGTIDEQQAIETALQAFEDGIYFCIIDETQIEQLDQVVSLSKTTRLTFIRLTLLAGG